jgi:hypothetical protein
MVFLGTTLGPELVHADPDLLVLRGPLLAVGDSLVITYVAKSLRGRITDRQPWLRVRLYVEEPDRPTGVASPRVSRVTLDDTVRLEELHFRQDAVGGRGFRISSELLVRGGTVHLSRELWLHPLGDQLLLPPPGLTVTAG